MTKIDLLKIARVLFLMIGSIMTIHSFSIFYLEEYKDVPLGFFVFSIFISFIFYVLFVLNELQVLKLKSQDESKEKSQY